jgi:hypothetical protein
LSANLGGVTEIPRMHIQTDENSVTLTPFGSVVQRGGGAAHRLRENMRVFEPADIILFAFVILLICVLLIAFVY